MQCVFGKAHHALATPAKLPSKHQLRSHDSCSSTTSCSSAPTPLHPTLAKASGRPAGNTAFPSLSLQAIPQRLQMQMLTRSPKARKTMPSMASQNHSRMTDPGSLPHARDPAAAMQQLQTVPTTPARWKEALGKAPAAGMPCWTLQIFMGPMSKNSEAWLRRCALAREMGRRNFASRMAAAFDKETQRHVFFLIFRSPSLTRLRRVLLLANTRGETPIRSEHLLSKAFQ